MTRLLLLFTVVPLVETYLLYLLGVTLGFWPTVGLVLLTAVLGAALAKAEGLRVWREWRRGLSQGRLPDEGILGGVLVLVGGVLLVAPGVLTDVTGILLLFPPSRRFIARRVHARLERRLAETPHIVHYRVDLRGARVGGAARYPRVIDAEGEVIEEHRG